MNNIMTIQGINCYEENGVAYLNLEAVARGLGFTQTQNKNGTEYVSVRWETVRKYLAELGFEVFPSLLGKDGLPDFIPENIFYRLAMKAKNETAEKFQALIADEVIPAIRKTGSYHAKPLSPVEMLELQVKVLREIENKQKQQTQAIAAVNQRVDAIGDIVALNPNDWRRECKAMVVRIADKLGGTLYIKDVQRDIYKLMLERFGIDLKRRLNNKRLRAADEGMCRSKRDKLTYLDVIAEDKRVIEGYIQLVKEMAVKHGVSLPDKEEKTA